MIKKLTGALASCMLLAASANAATMWIVGPPSVSIGETFEMQILGDFTGEGLIAGGITFSWTPLVQLDDVTLELPVVADFSCPGSVNCPPPGVNNTAIVWGEFLNNLIQVDSFAPTLMATLTFTAIGSFAENPVLFSMVTNDELTGGWFGADFNPIATPTFVDFKLVPLPAAVWFMVGGLGALAGFRRR